MSEELRFKSEEGESKEHQRFVEELAENGLVQKFDGSITSDDLETLKNFGFGLFLEWVFDHLDQEDFSFSDYSRHFAPLNEEKLLFFVRSDDKTLINGYNHRFVNDIFEGLASGYFDDPSPTSCSYCPMYQSLKVNQHIASKRYEWLKGLDYLPLPQPDENLNCNTCRDRLGSWIVEKVNEDERNVRVLGGFGIPISIKPDIFNFFITNERDIEKKFNSFIATFSAVITGMNNQNANVSLTEPFESTEIDAIIYDNAKNFLYAIETTRARSKREGVNTSHLKKKIYNAAVLDGLDIQKYTYIYMTLGDSEKFQEVENVHGSINLCRRLGDDYEINFEIISSSSDIISKDPSEYKPSLFRNSYEQLLDYLEEIINRK